MLVYGEEYQRIYEECSNKSKEELAALLAFEIVSKEMNKTFYPVSPYPIKQAEICKTYDDCTNPHYDCVNCPVHGGLPLNALNARQQSDLDELQFTC